MTMAEAPREAPAPRRGLDAKRRWVSRLQVILGTIFLTLSFLQLALLALQGSARLRGFEALLAPLGMAALGLGMIQRGIRSIALRLALTAAAALIAGAVAWSARR